LLYVPRCVIFIQDTSLGRTFGASEGTVTVGTVHPNLASSGSVSVATINTTGTCQFGSGGNLVTCQSIGPTGFGQVSNLCGPTAPGTPRKPKSPKSPGRAGANALSGPGNSGGMKGTPKSPKGAKLSAVTKVLSSPPQQQPQQQQYQQQPQSASIVMASCPGASIPSVLLTGSLSQLQARQSNGTTMQPLPSGPTSAVSRPTSVQHFLATGSLPPPPPPHHLHQQQSQPQLSQQPQAMQQHVVSAAPAYLVQRHPGGQLLATVSRQPAQLHTQTSMAIQSQYQRAGGMLTAVSSCVQIPSQSAPLQQQQQQQQQQQRQFSQTQLSQPALYVRTTRQPYPGEISDLITTDRNSVAGADQSINESLTSVLVTTGPSALPPQSSPYPPHVQLHHHQQAQSVVSFSQPVPQQMLLQQPAGHQLIQLKTSHGSQQTTQQLVDTTPGTNVCLSGMAQVGGVSLVGRMQPQQQQQLSTISLGQQMANHPSTTMPQHNAGKPGAHHLQLSTVGRMSPVSSRVVQQTNQACYVTQSQPQQQQQPHSHHQQQKVKLSVPAAQFQGYVQAGQQPTQQIIFQSQTGQQLIAHHQPVAAAVSRGSVTPTGLSPSGVLLRAIGPHSTISTSTSSTMCGILPTQSHLVTIASACIPIQGQSGKPVQLPIQPQLVRPNQAGSVNVVGLNAGTVSYHTGVCALTPTSGGENISPQQHAAMVRAAGPNQAMVQFRHAQPVAPSQTLTRPVSCNQQPVPTPVAPTPLIAPPAPPILPTYYGHEGAPKPTRPEECLIGCVFLLLGYRAATESQRALWRRVMRSYGAEVVMAYDPNRVTHLVIDCQLEEPTIVKQQNSIPDEFDPATIVSFHRSVSLSKLDDGTNYTPRHGYTDLSVWFPRSSSSYSSVDTSHMPPEPVIPWKEPPSPYVELNETLPQHSDPGCLDHDVLDELRPLTRTLSTVHVNPTLICAPVNGSTTPPSNSPSSSTLLLPDPPSRTKSNTTAPSTNSLCWPPTPSELQSRTTSHPRLKHVIARCSVCLDVVNVLITPYNDPWMSTSPTQMSPPTEVPLLESFMDRDSSIPSHTTNNLGYSAIDAFGDQPRHVTGDFVSISESHFSDTTQLGDPSCDMQSIKTTTVNSCLNRGDGVDIVGTKPPLSSKTILSQPPLNIRIPEKNEGCPRVFEPKQTTVRKEIGPPKPYGRREFRTVVSHLPTPCCLSDVFGSIRSRSLITSSPQLHQRYSTSLTSVSGVHMPSFLMTRSRPELWIDDEVPMFSQLFSVPDVHGLRISVSNYGIPLSPSACRLNNRLRTETTSRPADRRFQRILQRYPGSRADVLRETQRLHGAEYGFLILNTTAWNHMLCLTRDLDRCFPHWQLSRQLNRNRSARIMSVLIEKFIPRLFPFHLFSLYLCPHVLQALRDRIRIVTIFWVNDVLSKGRMIPPYEILHLPSPFSSDITFSFIRSQIISLTGFEGKDRLKVEFMIRQLGASFTDYLEPSNTLLVCKQPEGKKYEMAQSWSIPCVNVRWLQDIYFGDLMALALDIPHKYLSFEPADVTVSLDRCTPRVQDLMVGWQTPIRLNHDAWTRLTKLSNDFAAEERERKRKLELDVVSQPKGKKRAKCSLAPLSEADVKLAMTCRTRLELLIAEAREKNELQAALKEKLKRIVITEEQCPAQLPEVSELIMHGVQHKLADEECVLEENETTHSHTSIQSETSAEPAVKSELALAVGGTLMDSFTSQYASQNTLISTSVDSLLESNQSNRPSTLATSSFSAVPSSAEPGTMKQMAPVVSPLTITQAGGSAGNEMKSSDSPKQTGCQGRNEMLTDDTEQSVVSLDVVHGVSKAECGIISIKPEDETLGNNQRAVGQPVGDVPQLSDELVAVKSFSAPAVSISNADVPVSPSVVPSRKRIATDDLSDVHTKRPATDPSVDKGDISETTSTVETTIPSQAPLISISAPSADGLPAETPRPVVQTDAEASVVKRSEDCIPQSPTTINTSVRIAFTAIDYESRLSLVELCLQLPDCQMVDSAEDATHLVCSRLLRTPKTYIAVALGRYLVTPKWIQASVLRGVWLDETPWLLSDPDAETQLGVRLSDSMVRARRRQMLGPEASLFAGLEFWLSPGACHREMCATLIRAGGGVVRHKRPTQKMALLPQPRQLIICHEDDSNVANYLMRLKTGNKAVHHEEFILSGVLRQELDYESYQIQYVNTLQSSLKAAVAAAEAALAHGGAMPQVPHTAVTECFGVSQAEVVCSTTGNRRPSLGTIECASLDDRPVEKDPRPINHPLVSTGPPTRTSLESPRTPIIRTGSTDGSSSLSHSVSMNSYASLDTYSILASEARYSTPGTPLRPFAVQRQSVDLTETPGHSMAPPIPKTHICRPTVPTGLQHLLADSMDHSHLPQDYYPTSYRAHGPYDLVPSSRYRHPDAIHQSPLNTSAGTFCVTRATDGSSSYADNTATAVNSSAVVSAHHRNVTLTTRHKYDPGPPGTEVTSEPQRSISRPRASGLLLSGPLTIPGTSYPTHRPVTALTAMIVAAESSTNDIASLASTEATGSTSVSTFGLPTSTATFRAPCVTSSMMTQSSGLNARSAAADAHAVATATAAAANALIQSDRKTGVSLNDSGTSVPRARSPRTTLSASLFVTDLSENKKPRIPVMHSISSGLSNTSLDAVTSLISAPMIFQMPAGTSDLTNLCHSYSPSLYSVGDHLHISTSHPVESLTTLSCASTTAASLHSPVGRSLFPKVVPNFVDSDLVRSASSEFYPPLSVSSPSISTSVGLNSSTQSVTITENTAFLLMANNLMSTSGDIRPPVCLLPSSITSVSEPNPEHLIEQRNAHTTILSSSTHSASPSAEYSGALPSSDFDFNNLRCPSRSLD
ncbi:hypothetical protein AHF37_05338, partial [Paragonimus kellicotti]